MKKTLNHIFDEANAGEIDNFVEHNAAPDISADTLSSIKDKVYAKTNLKKEKKPPIRIWLRFGAIAACFALILSAVIVVPLLREEDITETPTWNTAHYSAEAVAKMFGDTSTLLPSSAYREVCVPHEKYLYVDEIPDNDHLGIYRHTPKNYEPDADELQAFIDGIIPKLSASLNEKLPQYSLETNSIPSLLSRFNIGTLGAYAGQYQTQLSFTLRSQITSKQDITLDGETVQIDSNLSDEDIIESLQSIKNKLFGIFNVSFSDVTITRFYLEGSDNNNLVGIYVYFYDKDAHPLNSELNQPISDYIFINFSKWKDSTPENIVVADYINYIKHRNDFSEDYHLTANAKIISLSEAEALLYNGYVFGGLFCPLCSDTQNKISFEGYDFVDIEYVMGINYEILPFYAFYKKTRELENGNLIYVKAYVAAIPVSGYREYFESHQGHSNVPEQ